MLPGSSENHLQLWDDIVEKQISDDLLQCKVIGIGIQGKRACFFPFHIALFRSFTALSSSIVIENEDVEYPTKNDDFARLGGQRAALMHILCSEIYLVMLLRLYLQRCVLQTFCLIVVLDFVIYNPNERRD